jgi:hypothetical protein
MSADRPFVDRPPADVPAATRLAERVATDVGLREPVLLKVGMNAIYRAGDVVLRVSHLNGPAASAYALADVLRAAGIVVARPAADRIVVVDDESSLTVTAWEHVESIGDEVDWFAIGAMVRRVRALGVDAVPEGYPVPLCTSYPWWRFDDVLADIAPDIDSEALDGIRRAIDEHGGWVEASGGVDGWVLCHGDVHPANVIAGPDGPVIIDWDLLCVGPPEWDHAPLRSMVERWGARPAWYADFASGYGEDLAHDPVTRSLTVLRLVAATLMRVKAARSNEVAGAEAARRLRYWRGDPDAPTWAMS